MDEELIIKTVRTVINEIMQQKKMSLRLAKALAEKVEEKAVSMGMRIVVAVSDEAGRPVLVHSMDGAYIGSFDIALNKTFTAVAFQMSTKELSKLSAPGASLYGIQHTNGGKIVTLGGGELLKLDGTIIGAIGVSGGTADDDSELALYGKELIDNKLLDNNLY